MRQIGDRKVWSVADVAGAVFRRLEDVPSVWIEAEVTNLGRRGGQVYFTLVDHGVQPPHQMDASMNAIVFERLARRPEDGTLIQAYGRVDYWPQRSQVRFRVERIELTGDGLLLARIEELRRRLESEGLTDDARKQALPFAPRRIGLVTSGEGAARSDFLTNVTARFPAVRVLVVHSLVQGDAAPDEIARAIRFLDREPDVDVIVLARGGGALEDLMAFNSELVCRTVAQAATPIVSAIGHESDVTVCDVVADLRVSTPTKAAEAVVPDAAALVAKIDRLDQALRRRLGDAAERRSRRVEERSRTLVTHLRRHERIADARSSAVGARLVPALRGRSSQAAEQLGGAGVALRRAVTTAVASRVSRVEQLAALHDVLSPARTVARGYAIVRRVRDGAVVAGVAAVEPGERVAIQLRDGTVDADVTGRSEGG